MKPEYIAKFEKLGLGMFVHFGLYSMIGKGEWIYANPPQVDKNYYMSAEFANKFNPKKDWAKKLVKAAKNAGAKYITLTTKHHEGFCLFDACGTTDWDALHYGPKRDLIKEYVDACNEEGIVPFFYYAILDWHRPDFDTDFKAYTDYLIDQVEILCKNYGKIGGLWFDGYWSKPGADWQFD
ncbi:MAG: alpha-L-fucosidase, partial [Bacilli bacterium]|nr:alpha-L-fucosidase [Bacilli bacterium]